MASKTREIMRVAVNKFFGMFGLKVVKSDTYCLRHDDYVKMSPFVSFGHFSELLVAYEYLFQTYTGSVLSENELRHQIMGRLLGTPTPKAYFLVQALQKTGPVSGDVCEFGVAQGETSSLIANEIRESNKLLHLFDSFEGLPKPTSKDVLLNDLYGLNSMDKYAGVMACPEDMVIARLQAVQFPQGRYALHKGFFEDIVKKDKKLPNQVSFAYVDFDFYEPTKLALEFLDGVTSPGAMFIIDDYGYFSSGAKTAVDEFILEKNIGKPAYKIDKPDRELGLFVVIEKL